MRLEATRAARPALAGAVLTTLAALSAAGADEPAPDLPRSVRGLDGRSIPLEAPAGGVAAVVFYSAECPISNAYSPTLNALARAFPAARFRLVGLCTDPDLSDAELAAHAKEYSLAFPVARDRAGAIARALGAKVTPEAFVLDDRGRVRYRGRIDDQWAGRRVRNATAATHELRDAVAAVLDGREVPVPRTEAVGCPLPEPPRSEAGS